MQTMTPPDKIPDVISCEPVERHMFLVIVGSRVYVFKTKDGRAAAANYLRVYCGIRDMKFAEAKVSRDIVPDSRKVRGSIKMHWHECLIGAPVPFDTYSE